MIERREGAALLDALVIGAGPCGIAASAALKKYGLNHVVLDKSCIVSTIYRFPTNMVFNSTPQLLEIGEIPFYIQGAKPTRSEALTYYRTVVDRLALPVHQYETVTKIERNQFDQSFFVYSQEQMGMEHVYKTKRVIISTGYFDNPNMLGIDGENLPHVLHYYTDAHPYFGQDVLVIGGTNSAAEAVIDLYRMGSKVTLVHRGMELSSHIKPWIRPEIQSLIDKNLVPIHLRSTVKRIYANGTVDIATPDGPLQIQARHVLALTGYHPNVGFLKTFGIHIDEQTGIPEHNETTYETNVPGIYIAGVIVSGYHANRIFIETGRNHGMAIAEAIEEQNRKKSLV